MASAAWVSTFGCVSRGGCSRRGGWSAGWCLGLDDGARWEPGPPNPHLCDQSITPCPVPARELHGNSCILGSLAFGLLLRISSLCALARGQGPNRYLSFPFLLGSSWVLTRQVCAPMAEWHGASRSSWLASDWLWQSLEDVAHDVLVWLCLLRPAISVSP